MKLYIYNYNIEIANNKIIFFFVKVKILLGTLLGILLNY